MHKPTNPSLEAFCFDSEPLKVWDAADEELLAIRSLMRRAFLDPGTGMRGVTESEVDRMLHTDTDQAFIESIQQPAMAFAEVDPITGEPTVNQMFAHRRINRAYDNSGNLAGAIISADNTSGTPLERGFKMALTPRLPLPQSMNKRYLHNRITVVDPEYQRRGIGARLLWEAMRGKPDRQRVTAYSWQDLLPMVPDELGKAGFIKTPGDQEVRLFSTERIVVQQRYESGVGTVRQKVTEAIERHQK